MVFPRILLLLPCVWFVLAPGAATAATISVRGGIHEDFNRLVFDFPQPPHYKIARAPDGTVRIDVPGPAVALRLDALAARLSRIAGLASTVTADGTQLSFRIAPAASLHDFLSGTALVIDVQGPPAPAEAAVTATSATTSVAPATAPSGPAVRYSRAGSSFAFTRAKIVAPRDAVAVEAPAGLVGWRRGDDAGLPLSFGPAEPAAADGAPTAEADVVADPTFALGGRVIVKLAGATAPATVTDPVVGDALVLVPAPPGATVATLRHYAGFDLLPARQGLVVRPRTDRLQVRTVADGIEITVPGGLALSPTPPAPPPELAAPEAKAIVTEPAAVTAAAPDSTTPAAPSPAAELLPLEQWQPQAGETFTDARRRLQNAAAAADPDDRAKPRLDLARLYLASGDGPEAQGILRLVASQSPDLANRPDAKGLLAFAQVLIGTRDAAQAAATALSAPALGDFGDVPLWRAMALAEGGDLAGAAPLFAQNLEALGRLQEPLFTRFSDLAAEAFLAAGDNDRATRVIDGLAKRGGADALRRPGILYDRGVLQSRIGTLDEAKALWAQAAESEDQLARSRAGLALVALGIADKSLAPADAAARLERLRYGWRGDTLELDLLRRLADAYAATGQLDEALGALDRAKRIAPDDQQGIAALEAEQRRVFASLFLGPALKEMPALKTLSTYRRYKQYAPTDPAQASQVDDRLFDKMIAIDLLGAAAELLDGEAARAGDAPAKAKLGARSAGLRLLNGEAPLALKALDATEAPGLPADLAEERKLLRARALGDQMGDQARTKDQAAPAVALLTGDTNPDAQRLAATIAWRAADWPQAATALAALLPPSLPGKATDEQAQLILRRAVALSLAGDTAALAALGQTYGAALKDTPQQASFALLVAPDAVPDRSLASVQNELKDIDLFKGFLDSYRK